MEQSTRLILVVNNMWQEVVQTPSIYRLLSKPKRLPRSSWRIRLLTLRNTINLPNVVGEKMLQNDYSKVAWETVIAFDNNLSVPRASSSSAGPTFLLSQNYLAAKTKGLTRHLLRVLVQMNITSVWHLCFIICSNFRTWPVPNWCGISNQTGPNSFHCRKKEHVWSVNQSNLAARRFYQTTERQCPTLVWLAKLKAFKSLHQPKSTRLGLVLACDICNSRN